MGYDYCFYLSVDDLEIFKNYKNAAIHAHNALKVRDWFPVFGQCEHSSAMGYGTGPNDNLLPEFASFTSQFPDFIFKLWMTYWDNTNLYMVEIKDTIVLSENQIDFESINVAPGLTIQVSLSSDNMDIENDITDWFR